MIPLTCTQCKKTLRLRDELAGRRIKCPGCGGTLTVPLLEEEVDDLPPPKNKAATFTPTKPSPVRDDGAEDEDRARRKTKNSPNVGKPNVAFLIVGLILGIGGLIAMSVCIVFAKQANDELENKQHMLDQRRPELETELPFASDDLKKTRKAELERLESEIGDYRRGHFTHYVILAAVCGVVFLIGFGIRGYYHVAIKKWHAEVHGTGKKRKRRAVDDEDEEEDA